MKNQLSNMLSKATISLLKTGGIYFVSAILNQQLRNSTKDTVETITQQVRVLKNNYNNRYINNLEEPN